MFGFSSHFCDKHMVGLPVSGAARNTQGELETLTRRHPYFLLAVWAPNDRLMGRGPAITSYRLI